MDTKKSVQVHKRESFTTWKGRNFIREIRAEQAEKRKLDPTYRKLTVKHLNNETMFRLKANEDR
jgi:hypothetical protein